MLVNAHLMCNDMRSWANTSIDLAGGQCTPVSGERAFDGRVRRRVFIRAFFGGLSFVGGHAAMARAESPTAPIPIQARILARILPFDRGFAGRAGSTVPVVIAFRDGDADSSSAAKQMDKALSDIGDIAQKSVNVVTVRYESAARLVDECRKRDAAASYLSPGLGNEIHAIAQAMARHPILTLASVETYVPAGAVLGVEVISGKPRISINLPQAKLQGIDFPSALLKLARVYQ